MRIRAVILVAVLFLSQSIAGDNPLEDFNANIQLPAFNAKLSIGFNYDLLRAPTDVSFEYPKGYFGFNLPIEQSINLRDFLNYADPAIDSIFSDTTIFSDGENFKPRGKVRQNPNTTFSVDVPMMGGVASFSNTQNFFLGYSNVLGNPGIYANPDSLGEGVSFLLRGTINVPLDLSLGWETMTFGYAYRINRYLTMALNLHRHLFTMDLQGKINVNLMGKLKYEATGEGAGNLDMDMELDYPSDKVYGMAYGHYEAEVWTPTIGLKAWRFTLTSRFGINTRAKGEFYARYSLPFFVDPETFKLNLDFEDPSQFTDPEFLNNLNANAVDSITYSTRINGKDCGLQWKMPTGITLGFDIIPKHLGISYTKTFGDVLFKIDRIAREQVAAEQGSDRSGKSDSLVIDMGVNVDHVILLHCSIYSAFLNLGVFGMDFRYADQENMIGSKMPYMHMGKSAMFPVLNFGSTIGTKLRLLIELDVLPLPAVKTGVLYFF